jgi:hypothetical protein
MLFLGLLVLCIIAFVAGFGAQWMWLVLLVAALGLAAVITGAVSGDAENPVFVAVVQLVCVGVIVGCSALGLVARSAARHRTR